MTRVLPLVVALVLGPQVLAQDRDNNADDDLELRLIRAEFSLLAARIDRACSLLEAEMKGKDVRNALEKAGENLLITRYNLGKAKVDVATKTMEIRRGAEASENLNKKRHVPSETEKVRNEKLATCKEVADYRDASERLLGLVRKREKALREASESGKEIRTELEKAAAKLNQALADSTEYQAAVRRLKAARQGKVITDLALTESPSVPLRAALLRVEIMAGKK